MIPVTKTTLESIAYLVGYNLGDGNVSRNLCNTWFYGVNSDLEGIKKLLFKFKVRPVIYTYKINNGKMAVHDSVFSRFLVCYGAVIGDKTKADITVPKWILTSGKASKLKRRFLQGFFDSELSNITLMKNKPLSYQSLSIYHVKIKNKIKEGKFFLNQLRYILREFNVLSSEVKLDRSYLRSRDGGLMQQLYLTIYSNRINLYNFIENVGFLYNSKRSKSSLIALEKIKSLAVQEWNKFKKYPEALKLRKSGLSACKVATKLGLKYYHVRNWFCYNKKPVLYNYIKKLNSS